MTEFGRQLNKNGKCMIEKDKVGIPLIKTGV